MRFFAPAKINLSFKILRRREDGFHEIDTLMTPISLKDELTIEPAESEAALIFSSDDPTLLQDESNLVVRAARAFYREISAPPFARIFLRKRIPHGAGLGGGSSDAASTLLGLNELYGAPIAITRLTSLAAELGSDVPFFLAGGAARCRGRGEIVESVSPPQPLSLLLCKPEFGVPTPSAYQQWNDSLDLPNVDYNPQQVAGLELVNDLERPVFEKHIFLARMKTWLRQQPEIAAALLSGSGSTMFAILRDSSAGDAVASRARAELDPNLWTFAANSLG
ncbi:MAG TPA: 4-(cytidine 5'-diphospho)-2-C-methyl-D-erythritol kinase [Chthoniobacterales bacterium]|jgi:4-diphosphocytidyl-2-C-methyl-D-erythritol kinase